MSILKFSTLHSQLIISSPLKNLHDADSLINKVLLGKGIYATNIKYMAFYDTAHKPLDTTNLPHQYLNAHSAQIGVFSTGPDSTNLGISNGIILSNGDILRAPGPNHYDEADVCWQCWCMTELGPGHDIDCQHRDFDIELLQKCYHCSYDVANLEFDFTPTFTPITFRYVFASDEYPTWVCSQYNDKFAFFVTSLNSDGYNYKDTNIALIPGTRLPVGINTVNSGKPGRPEDSLGCTSLSYSKYFINNKGGTTIKYNGFTQVFTAHLDVIPCKAYHIKLEIADINDPFVDSSVFLEAASFSSPDITHLSFRNPQIDSTAIVRQCNNAIVSFKLPAPLPKDSLVHFTITGANYKSDYTILPHSKFSVLSSQPSNSNFSILIKAHNDTASFDIHALSHGTADSLHISITGCTGPLVKTIKIKGLKALPSPDTTICAGGTANLSVKTLASIPPLTYSWSSNPPNSYVNTIHSPSFTLSYSQILSTTTTYSAYISDLCNSDTFKIILQKKNTLDTSHLSITSPNGLMGKWANGLITAFSPLTLTFQYNDPSLNPIWYITSPNGLMGKWANGLITFTFISTSTTSPTDYLLILKSNDICNDSIIYHVSIPPSFITTIPNLISYSRDNAFKINGNGIKSIDIKIYNRWGINIFTSHNDYSQLENQQMGTSANGLMGTCYSLWDGSINSSPSPQPPAPCSENPPPCSRNCAPAGVYFYLITPLDFNRNIISPKNGSLKGTITIIK